MRKTAEPRENKIGPRADCQNKSDVSHHSNARPDSAKMSIVGHGLARSLTSLTRFGTSFWALILAACGGGGAAVVVARRLAVHRQLAPQQAAPQQAA